MDRREGYFESVVSYAGGGFHRAIVGLAGHWLSLDFVLFCRLPFCLFNRGRGGTLEEGGGGGGM